MRTKGMKGVKAASVVKYDVPEISARLANLLELYQAFCYHARKEEQERTSMKLEDSDAADPPKNHFLNPTPASSSRWSRTLTSLLATGMIPQSLHGHGTAGAVTGAATINISIGTKMKSQRVMAVVKEKRLCMDKSTRRQIFFVPEDYNLSIEKELSTYANTIDFKYMSELMNKLSDSGFNPDKKNPLVDQDSHRHHGSQIFSLPALHPLREVRTLIPC